MLSWRSVAWANQLLAWQPTVKTTTPQWSCGQASTEYLGKIEYQNELVPACRKGTKRISGYGQNHALNHIAAITWKGADQSPRKSDTDNHMSCDWLSKRPRGGYVAGDNAGRCGIWWHLGGLANDQRSSNPTVWIPHTHVGAETRLCDQWDGTAWTRALFPLYCGHGRACLST